MELVSLTFVIWSLEQSEESRDRCASIPIFNSCHSQTMVASHITGWSCGSKKICVHPCVSSDLCLRGSCGFSRAWLMLTSGVSWGGVRWMHGGTSLRGTGWGRPSLLSARQASAVLPPTSGLGHSFRRPALPPYLPPSLLPSLVAFVAFAPVRRVVVHHPHVLPVVVCAVLHGPLLSSYALVPHAASAHVKEQCCCPPSACFSSVAGS